MICTYCREHYPDNIMTYDHYIPKSKGGSNDKENLVIACFYCNSSKGRKVFKTRDEFLEFQAYRMRSVAYEKDSKRGKKLEEKEKK
jgi:5-methylcytosine-specific restriction endonuclease McrA